MDENNGALQPDVEQSEFQTANEEEKAQKEKETLDAIIAKYSSLSREQLVEELKSLVNNGDYEQMRMRVPLVRNAFQAIPQHEDIEQVENKIEEEENKIENKETEVEAPKQNVLEEDFYVFYDLYKQKRQAYLEEEESKKRENLKSKQALLEDLRALIESEKTLKEIYDDFNAIQDKWKSVGNVPHTEVNNLWENYHFLMDKFYEKVKINRELRDLDMKKNLEEKLILCEKAEELLISEDINNSFQILQDYHKQWKEIGPVPSDKNDEVWERFKKASDDINARRREYYEKRSEELEENYKQKQDLVAQAAEINSHTRENNSDWNRDADAMNAIVEKWKSIGPVPRQYNEEIWSQFKAQKDGFFGARKEVYVQHKQQEDDNYNKKLAICQRAEEIAKRTDFAQATKDIKALQEEWKQIGYVRKSLSDKIWLRFRAACDEFFKQKSEDYMRTHKEVEENIKKKEDLIAELTSHVFSDDKAQNVEVLKDFQKRWFDVGFVPKQERAKLQQKWDEIIDTNKEKLQITAMEIAQKSSKTPSGARAIVDSSKETINARLRVLEKQIEARENNLGFLAHSKNADLLKKEFEAKINDLREERNNLINKLKALNETTQKRDNEPKSGVNEPIKEDNVVEENKEN